MFGRLDKSKHRPIAFAKYVKIHDSYMESYYKKAMVASDTLDWDLSDQPMVTLKGKIFSEMIRHDDFLKKLTPERRRKIKARANELLAEEMTLRQLRKARQRSQETMAEVLGVRQGDLSKLERRTDAYLSTIRRYVEAMGGKLDLIASYPNSKPVKITHIGDFIQDDLKQKHA